MTANEEERRKDEKEKELERRRHVLMQRCAKKIARKQLQAEQRQAYEKELKLVHAQRAVNLKQREIETLHKLAAELSRRKNDEVKQMLKFARMKPTEHLLSCDTNARSHLIEKKVHLESKQAELLNLWHQDKSFDKLQQAEEEKKKQDLHCYLQTQLANKRQLVQGRKSEEIDQDRKMINYVMKEIDKEDIKMKKKKDNAIHRRTEMAAFMAIKNAWDKEYKEVLKHEDQRIARVIAEKEAQQKELLDKKTELRAMREATIAKVAKKLLHNGDKKREREKISNELYQEEQILKSAEEPAKLVSRKQYAIAESLKEMARSLTESFF